MTTDRTAAGPVPKRPWRFWLWLTAMALLFAVLFYQSVNYVGVMHVFAELQFKYMDRYFPVLSIIGILIFLYLLWEAVRLMLRRARRSPPTETLVLQQVLARRSAVLFLHISAAVGALLMVSTAIQWFQQPSSSGPATPVALGTGRSAELVAGPVEVSGIRAIGPIARYSEDFLFMRRTRFLAPIGRSSGPGAPYNLFVEVRGMDPARDVPLRIDGVLRYNALMPEIRVLYGDANFPVARNSAVIFATPASANRPFIVLLIELLVMTALMLLFARYLRRSADDLQQGTEN